MIRYSELLRQLIKPVGASYSSNIVSLTLSISSVSNQQFLYIISIGSPIFSNSFFHFLIWCFYSFSYMKIFQLSSKFNFSNIAELLTLFKFANSSIHLSISTSINVYIF